MIDKNKATISLDQNQANLALRALELLSDDCAAAVDAENVEKISVIWNLVLDAGLDVGFGKLNEDPE